MCIYFSQSLYMYQTNITSVCVFLLVKDVSLHVTSIGSLQRTGIGGEAADRKGLDATFVAGLCHHHLGKHGVETLEHCSELLPEPFPVLGGLCLQEGSHAQGRMECGVQSVSEASIRWRLEFHVSGGSPIYYLCH